MKIQELAIIFVIIILPISLLLSEYTQFQIKTINTQTVYDSKLTAATYDAIKAFQLNSGHESYSDIANQKINEVKASVAAFRNSIKTAFKLTGHNEEELNRYIPALVYTLYDGFYIYSPYDNTNYQYETDAAGNKILTNGNGDTIYGLKSYINYSCRYIKGDIDVVISYSLDNYVHVRGKIGSDYINKGGYLIDHITILGDMVKYNEVEILPEALYEEIDGRACLYIKENGTKYYWLDTEEKIVYNKNGELTEQTSKQKNRDAYENMLQRMQDNNSAKEYYKSASAFTDWFKSSGLAGLQYSHAYDEVINRVDGTIGLNQIWPDNNTTIFDFNTGLDISNNIENETSNFNQHRLAIIRQKIETNLAVAISNYNNYSEAAPSNVFQMPELKENEWDYITNNISVISFLQGLPIGGKIYNGYTVVTNSESKEVVLEENIYLLGNDNNYHRIGDKDIETSGSVNIDNGVATSQGRKGNGTTNSAGRLNLDFKRAALIKDGTYYYYPLTKYDGSYNSIVMQKSVTTYDDIYQYVNSQEYNYKQAFYTALGRERTGKFNSNIQIKIDPIQFASQNNPEVINSYKITYDGNGNGDEVFNVPGEHVKEPGEIIEIAGNGANKPYRNGYIFLGWSTIPNAVGPNDNYKPGTLYRNDEDLTLYAIWKKDVYIVTYEGNGGLGVPPQYTVEQGNAMQVSLVVPTKENYTFLGWSTSSTATTPTYVSGQTITPTSNMTLYAVWKHNEYKITFDENGGTGGTRTVTIRVGEKITIPSATKDKYKLLGWSTSSTATTPTYQVGNEITPYSDMYLYAIWERNTYIISFVNNNGTVSQEINKGESIVMPADNSLGGGYQFLGWSENELATNAQYVQGQNITPNRDMKLYAIWQVQKYTVTYNVKGGNENIDPKTVNAGTKITLPSTERDNYTFKGWSVQDDNTADAGYGAGAQITVNKNMTLYAVWERNKYTITFVKASGTVSEQIYQGDSITLPKDDSTNNGYKFLGWSTSSSATSVTYSANQTITPTGNMTLYAVWQYNRYTITYDGNGGTSEKNSDTIDIGQSVTLPSATRDKYTLLGWSTSSSATSATYSANQNITPNGNMTLYAIWKENEVVTYTITYDANGGDGGPGTQPAKAGEKVTIPSDKPTKVRMNMVIFKTYWTFKGWSTTKPTSDGTGTAEYQPGAQITVNSDITLYAVWGDSTSGGSGGSGGGTTPTVKYTVTYDANGGEGAPSSKTVDAGEKVTIPSDKPTKVRMNMVIFKTYWTFKGWSTTKPTSDGTGTAEYQPGAQITVNSNITLYAVWGN